MNVVMVESFAQAILKSQKKFEEKMEYFNAKYLYLMNLRTARRAASAEEIEEL
ncbi:hypothetical protein AGMMS50233_03310 [Endomicrobiia bacterium]|nr:hypothetical protein AGMMS50233_03310 [Endomicrobiia bacterium]